MAGQLIVSLDFELFWGMLDCSTLEKYGDNVMGGRAAIPRLLELFRKYGVDYVYVSSHERANYNIDFEALQSGFELVFDGGVQIYAVEDAA